MVPIANDAGTAFVDVVPDLRGFQGKLASGINPHIDKTAGHVESKLGGAFKSVALAAGGLFAANLGVSAFKGIISGASDLNETLSKSNTIFGDQGKAIEAWAGTAAKSFGQSKQGALDAAATFGNLFVQLGTGSGEAAKMSTQMVELASDFASFHNADPTDVIESMTAAFRGEYDAVQRYVPTINAAAVEQEALKMGLAKTTKELTAQDKALATQALLMKGAGAAMGDFARTSDGLANRQRILGAQFTDMKAKIGTALLPVVLRLMEGFMGLGRVVSGPLKTAFDAVRGAFLSFVSAFKAGDGDITSSGFNGTMEKIGSVARQVFDFIRDNAKPILIGLGAAFVALTAPITGIVALLVLAYTRFEGFRNVVNLVVRTALEQFGNLVEWFRSVWPQITEAVGHVVATIQALWRTFGDEIVSIARIAWDQIRNIVQTVIDVVRGIIQTVLAVINGDWGKAWDGIKTILSAAWDFIKSTVGNAIKLVGEILEAGLDIVRGAWERVWNQIKGFFAGVWDAIFNTARDGVAKIVDVFLGMVGTIIHAADSAFGWLPGIGDKLHDARVAFDNFRDEVNASIRGITEEKTIRINLVEAVSRENNTNLGTAGDPIAPEPSTDSGTSSGVQQFARGLEAGPVKGVRGQARLVIAHGGERFITDEQLSALRSGRSGGSTSASAGAGGGLDPALVEALWALAGRPLTVSASKVSEGQHKARRR